MIDSFEDLRSERRSFFCPNVLWKRMKKETNDCISISLYVRKAIEEKIERDSNVRDVYEV